MGAVIYLSELFFVRIWDFLRHWYVSSFYWLSERVFELLEYLDKSLALKINFRYLFYPLFQDRSAISYFVGFFFRLFKIIWALFVYGLILVLALTVYLVWICIPVFLVYKTLEAYGIKTNIF